jgi:hypothetical protein
MPCRPREIGIGGSENGVLVRRRFGCPGRIDAHERVWLIFEDVAGNFEARLNDHLLGQCERWCEFEVTALLRERNVLEMVLESARDETLIWQEVALEIRCQAFLRNVQVRRKSKNELLVAGEIAGASERPLDLYLLIDGANAGYRPIEAGQSFRFTTAQPTTAAIRVELVDAATVWHALDLVE